MEIVNNKKCFSKSLTPTVCSTPNPHNCVPRTASHTKILPPLHTFFKSSSTSFVFTLQGALQYMYVVHLLTKKIVIIVKGIQRCEIF